MACGKHCCHSTDEEKKGRLREVKWCISHTMRDKLGFYLDPSISKACVLIVIWNRLAQGLTTFEAERSIKGDVISLKKKKKAPKHIFSLFHTKEM